MRDPNTSPISLFFKAIAENCPSLIAVMLIGTICIMWLMEKTVPGELKTATLMVISFLFGNKFDLKKLIRNKSS